MIVQLYITTTGVSQTLPTSSAISYQFTKEKTLAQKTRTQSYSSPLERRKISSMQLVRTSLLNKDIPEKFKLGNLLITILIIDSTTTLIHSNHQHKLSTGQGFRNGKLFVVNNKFISLNLKFLTKKTKKRMQIWSTRQHKNRFICNDKH